jgi:DNA-binding NarL/FixJ family response regulator
MKDKITVAILEDLPEVGEGLKEIINEDAHLSCFQWYKTAEDAITFIPKNPADILIVDIGLPRASGIEAIRSLSDSCPDMQFCMFTVYEDDDKVFNSLKAGAKGYILKNAGPTKIVSAIHELIEGGSPMSPSIARRVLDFIQKGSKIPSLKELPLTEREIELLELLSQGLLYKEVADSMGITIGTVKQHIHKIYGKLQVSNKTEALNKFRNS